MRRFNDALAREPGIIATEIQTVGSKGYDGIAIAVVVADGREKRILDGNVSGIEPKSQNPPDVKD